MREVGAGDFEHKGGATRNEVVSMGLRVGVRMVIGVQEESIGLVDARVV